MKKNKAPIVTRKWLMDFADTIYNQKTKEFLNLCYGTLKNGPDPKNPKRAMHCGLGELYFQLTGKQPDLNKVNETTVVELVVEHSSLLEKVKSDSTFIKEFIKNSSLKSDLNNTLWYVDEFKPYQSVVIEKFRDVLDTIPHENDTEYQTGTLAVFRGRAKRVANVLRKAAKMLPE